MSAPTLVFDSMKHYETEAKRMSGKVITGDLIQFAKEGKFDVIVHGCNCMCRMGAGIAKQIKEDFPEAWVADQNTKLGDESKLGSYCVAAIKIHYKEDDPDNKDGYWLKEKTIFVVNAYTQYGWKGLNGVSKPITQLDRIQLIPTLYQMQAKLYGLGFQSSFPWSLSGLCARRNRFLSV